MEMQTFASSRSCGCELCGARNVSVSIAHDVVHGDMHVPKCVSRVSNIEGSVSMARDVVHGDIQNA